MATKKPTKPRSKNARFLGVPCLKMKPTRQHRPAVWENMLGTVYALDDKGECKYFDYDLKAALEFAGVDKKAPDNRVYRVTRETNYGYVRSGCSEANPRLGKLVLWVKKAPKK